MRGTGGGKNWVFLWWARPCSVKLSSNCLLMGGVVHPPWYFFDLRLPSPQVYGLYGLHQGGPSQTSAAGARTPVVSPCWTTPPQETLQPQQIVLVQSPVESLLLSSKSCCMQSFICALQDWSLCFPQSCGSRVIKSHWPSRPDSLESPSPFVGSPGWKLDIGFRTFTTVKNFFGAIVLQYTWWVWNLILSWLCPSYHLTMVSSLSLDVGYLFW